MDGKKRHSFVALEMRLRAQGFGTFNILIRKLHKLRLAVAERFVEKPFVLGEG